MRALVVMVGLAGCGAGSVGTVEVCNGVDDDLDGVIDEDAVDAVAVWVDGDGDGYGRGDPRWLCDPTGQATKGGDCDDTHPDVWPGRPERCNGLDDDCDGLVGDEERDGDADGWPACWDCNDDDAFIHPEADEICNRRDDDCDGEVDEQPVDGVMHFADEDGDGFGAIEGQALECRVPHGRITRGGDCDDDAPHVHPGVRERCDDVDHNCDGIRWPRVTVPRDVSRLDDAVARVPAGQTVCVEPGEHSFSSLQIEDIWIEGTADGVILKSPITMLPGAGLRRVSVLSPVRVSRDGTTLEDVTLRGAAILPSNDGAGVVVKNLRVTGQCLGIELGETSVDGLRIDNLSTSCTIGVGDVTDLEIEHVKHERGGRGPLLRAGDVTGFVIDDVDAWGTAVLSGGALEDGHVSDVDLHGSTLVVARMMSDVVIERATGENYRYHDSRLVNLEYGEGDHLSLRDLRWSGGRLDGPLLRGAKFSDISIYNVTIDAEHTLGAVVVGYELRRIDVREIEVRGALQGLVYSSGIAKVKGLIVAGVQAEEAPYGIVHAGPGTISQATLTGISGDGPLLGAGIWDTSNIDVSWCDVGALSVDVGVSYSNVWKSGASEWSRSSSPLAVDPGYAHRSGSDATLWDLHLKSTSSLIDAGDPSSEKDDDGSTADVGAYGGPRGSLW